jgi:hypothetical protein
MAAMTGSIWAQNLDRDPSYVDFGNLERIFGDEPKLEVTLKGALLRLARQVSSKDEPEMADMMRDIRGIYIRGYKVNANSFVEAKSRMSEVARGLEGHGWDIMTRVRDEESLVYILTKESNDQIIQGMTIMVMDMDGNDNDNMAMFINIVGRVDPDKVGRMMKGMNININIGDDKDAPRHDRDRDNKDDN